MKLDKIKRRYDIIIIGCGLSGISLALELNSKTKKSVLILEKKKKIRERQELVFLELPFKSFNKQV